MARQAGIKEVVVCGHADRCDYIIEAMSCGAAFFDYDNDGWLESSSSRARGSAIRRRRASNRLYKNNRDGTFTDVTEKAGLFRTGYAYGVTVGDYNNDGFEDLFITCWGQNMLYRNNGDGTFTDVTQAGRPARTPGRASAPAARSSITTATASSICSSPTISTFDPKTVPRAGADRQLQLQRCPGELRAARPAVRPSLALPQQRRRHVHRRHEQRPASARLNGGTD